MLPIISQHLCRQFNYYEFFPFVWSFAIKLISHFFQYPYALSVVRNLDLALTANNKNDAKLIYRARIACEANTRFTLFVTLLTSGLGAVVINVKNNFPGIGIIIASAILFGLLVYYLLAETKIHEAYFTKNKKRSRLILLIFLASDLILLGISYFTAPLCSA